MPARASSPQEAEEAFRRARGLLTADRLEAWLASWDIDAEDFRRWTTDVASGTSTATPWCTLLCSGEFDAIATEIACAAAAACELDAGPVSATDFDPAGWADRLVSASTTDEHLNRVIEARRLDWTRLRTLAAVTTGRAVVEELRHQVLSDGIDLRAAAARAGCAVRETDDVLASFTTPGLRATLAGARTGELVGPVPTSSAWTLISVLARTDPALADPATRARAAAAVRDDVLARAVARHVVA